MQHDCFENFISLSVKKISDIIIDPIWVIQNEIEETIITVIARWQTLMKANTLVYMRFFNTKTVYNKWIA